MFLILHQIIVYLTVMLVKYSVHVCAHCTSMHTLCGMTSSLVSHRFVHPLPICKWWINLDCPAHQFLFHPCSIMYGFK